ncbi:Uncharacterised protein [Bacteroides xylanisolvens]|nr:Uncharacterised protein [Bacteroides xylanisolvens]
MRGAFYAAKIDTAMGDGSLWRHSLQSGTSAFHGSCRTSTAKLRSRVCRGGESCI